MKPDLRTRLATLATLDDGELQAFNADVIEALGSLPVGEDSTAGIGELHALTAAADAVRYECGRRETALLASTEPVTASGAKPGKVARMAARQTKPKASPETASTTTGAVLTASGNLRGIDPGRPIEDRNELGAGICRTLDALTMPSHRSPDTIIASARWHYPEDRVLTADQEHNAKLIDAVCHPDAIVATGGICSPVNVDYTVPTWASAKRPLRDGFAAFETPRGGLIYRQPLDVGALSAATGVWTEATDASPGGATKPIYTASCPSPVTVYTEAVSTRLGFGNMQMRFDPEWAAQIVDLSIAAAARTAENNLLNLLAAQCTTGVTSSVLLGATRDLLTAVDQAAAGYRSSHRLDRTVTLTVVFPDWVRDLLRADLARETAHAQGSDWNSLAISDDQLDELFAARGIQPIWHLDGQPSGVSGGVAQVFAVQGATGAVETFPSKLVWYLYPSGSVQFLDGGTLDLGIVRDSLLDSTNDLEMFVETFEQLAFRGFTGGAVQYVSSLCGNGGSAGTISTAGSCA